MKPETARETSLQVMMEDTVIPSIIGARLLPEKLEWLETGPMARVMMENGQLEKDMVKEVLRLQKVVAIKERGQMTKEMELECFIMLINQFIKENGESQNGMHKEQ